jgi:branched-subunit amino acid ABC-type transport system permease component
VFALVAIGLVVTYETSGVFNLAFGAQAYTSAVIFYVTVQQHHWPKWAAFVVAVAVVGPAIGVIGDRLLFRHIRTSAVAVKLAVAIGLMVGIPSLVDFAFGTAQKLRPPSIAAHPDHVYRFGQYRVDGNQLVTVLVTVGLVVVLGMVFRSTTRPTVTSTVTSWLPSTWY